MLPNYKNILVATDLKHAVVMARRNQARIHLLHIVPEVDPAMRSCISAMIKGSLDRFDARQEEGARQEIRTRLQTFAEDKLADHPEDLERITSVEVLHDDPVARILPAAARLAANLIVMETYGKGPLEYAFLPR